MSRIGRVVLVGFVLTFLLLPVLLVIPMSLNHTRYLSFPPEDTSFRWYETFLQSPQWTGSLRRSVEVGVLAALLATLLGTGAALALVRGSGRLNTLIRTVVVLPLIIPLIVLAAAYFSAFAEIGMIGSTLALAVAHATLGLPFVVFSTTAAVHQVGGRLEQAAWTMGARRWRAFGDTTFRLVAPSVVSGALFAFLTSFDEVVIALFVSGAATPTLPARFFSLLATEVTPVLAAASTILILGVLVGCFLLVGSRTLRNRRASAFHRRTA